MVAHAAPQFDAQSLAACAAHVDHDKAFARRGRDTASGVNARIIRRGGDRNDGAGRARQPLGRQ